jgi:hypothetical protein
MHPILTKRIEIPRLIKVGAAVVLAVIGYHILGPFDYDCFRCGASKTWYTVCETDTSQIARNIRGRDCDHDWVLNSITLGCGDYFARRKIPLTSHGTPEGLDLIPDKAWQKELLSALTDRRNRLKWAIPLIATGYFRSEIVTRDTEEDWKQWRSDFNPMFTPEYDLQYARAKAQVLSDAFISRSNLIRSSLLGKLLDDLELRKEDNYHLFDPPNAPCLP